MFSLYPDIQMTRRQRLHFIMGPDDKLAWSGKSLIAAIEWLKEGSHTEIDIVDESDDGSRVAVLSIL